VPISKRSYLLLSLIGFAALAWIHWAHSWPSLSHGHSFPDLGDSANASPWSEVAQTLTLLTLFSLYFYCLAKWEQLQFTARDVVWLIVAQGLFAWVALPANSTDIFGYIGLGRIAGLHGANPYVHTYSMFADSYWAYLEWDITMPYGPVLLPVFIFGGWISQHSVMASVFALKLFWLLTHGVNCRVLYLILKGWGRAPVLGLFLFALNPLLLLEQIANGHNDGVMMLFGMLGILALQRGRPTAALMLALLSALAKLPGLFFLFPVVVILARKREWRALIQAGVGGAALLFVLKITLFPTLASLLSLTNTGAYTKNSLHSLLILAGEKLSAWAGEPLGYDPLFLLDRCLFSVLFLGFCLWRLWKIFDLDGLVRETACLFLALLIGYATWFFPWYSAWLLPLAAITNSVRLRWAIVIFSCTAMAFYAFPHFLVEPPPSNWFPFMVRIAIAHLIPLGFLFWRSERINCG